MHQKRMGSGSSSLLEETATRVTEPLLWKKTWVFVLTFISYVSYHASRKPLSVVRTEFIDSNCSRTNGTNTSVANGRPCGWAPFDGSNSAFLLGCLDYAFLISYAVGMFISGPLAERLHLARYLGVGMVLSGITTASIGAAYFANVHSLTFFVGFQIVGGFVQASGYPAVVAIFSNWFGKSHRGLLMGIWSAHVFVGNILGSVVAALFLVDGWGWSFVVPAIFISALGVVVFVFLPPAPAVSLAEDGQNGDNDERLPFRSGSSVLTSLDEDEPFNSTSLHPLPGNLHPQPPPPITICDALKIPGIISYASSFFFVKLVAYTFLYWLPQYIKDETSLSPRNSGLMSTTFDVGGLFGGVVAGLASDLTGQRSLTCIAMNVGAIPVIFLYHYLRHEVNSSENVVLLFVCGFFVYGPYTLIGTAVCADLGGSESLRGNARATSTVTSIIDGCGSVGAAVGPLLTGVLVSWLSWKAAFYMLAVSTLLAAFPLVLLLPRTDFKDCFRRCL